MREGQTQPERGNPAGMIGNLDEETMVKVQAIMEQERAGTITKEQAQEQMAELGLELPVRGSRPSEESKPN
ncbi:hypothetical protein [Bacillus sp. Marseille-P3661]|uniref:hypothetical protein n=1 Tax=Bacillus sp. Marseille-P3661 TaxID=1936234 RepID=UPI000C84FE06|nr:hypothetical protein [Bacillus sp. Marseille-P3661]